MKEGCAAAEVADDEERAGDACAAEAGKEEVVEGEVKPRQGLTDYEEAEEDDVEPEPARTEPVDRMAGHCQDGRDLVDEEPPVESHASSVCYRAE